MFFYWTAFWILIISAHSLIKKYIIPHIDKKITCDFIKNTFIYASNNFFTFWLPAGCLVYFGYSLSRGFKLHLIYYIASWWLIWFVIWFIKSFFMLFFANAMERSTETLYSQRKKSIVNYITFILTYFLTYIIIFTMTCMKFFSLLFIIGIYLK